MLAHTGPRELDEHPLGGCGSGFGLRVEFLLKTESTLRVEFLFKTESGYLRDAEVT